MAMNDEETAALTCGGHTVGKATATAMHAARARSRKAAGSRRRASAGQPEHGRQGRQRVTSGIEGAWTTNPTKWDMGYFDCCSATSGS
jgi:catalase-peroxidase